MTRLMRAVRWLLCMSLCGECAQPERCIRNRGTT